MSKDFQYIVGYKKHKWSPTGKWGLLTFSGGKLTLLDKKGNIPINSDISSILIKPSGRFGATQVSSYYVFAPAGRLTDRFFRAFSQSISEFLKSHPNDPGLMQQLGYYKTLSPSLNWATLDMALGTGGVGGVIAVKEGLAGIGFSKMIQSSLLAAKGVVSKLVS